MKTFTHSQISKTPLPTLWVGFSLQNTHTYIIKVEQSLEPLIEDLNSKMSGRVAQQDRAIAF